MSTAALSGAGREQGDVVPAATWRVAAAGILSLVGLGLSVYLTITHFQPGLLVCSGNGAINCEAVTTSQWSSFPPWGPGVPVAILGLGFYVVTVVLNSPWAWRARQRWVHVARLVVSCLGMAFALWLVSAELLLINHICLYCTGVHVVTFLLFVLVLATVPGMLGWGTGPAAPDWEEEEDWEEEDPVG
jgi:uncharacterized membrane protein